MELDSQGIVALVSLGTLIPTSIWLWFWLRRDRFCPEPRVVIMGAFVFGALAALLSIPAQAMVVQLVGTTGILAMLLFVSIEETIKYIGCWYIALRTPYNNERIDPIIYLATSALGFAALENTLYFLNYLSNFSLDIAIIENGKRVIGATVLHTVASAIIGIALALVFKVRSKWVKTTAVVLGLMAAIVIHIGFNHLVTYTNVDYTLVAFTGVWLLFLVILTLLERFRNPVCPPEIDWLKQ